MSEVEKLLAGWERREALVYRSVAASRMRAAIAADKQAQPSGEVEALREIADIAAGSRTVNSLPHIERIARAALTAASKGSE